MKKIIFIAILSIITQAHSSDSTIFTHEKQDRVSKLTMMLEDGRQITWDFHQPHPLLSELKNFFQYSDPVTVKHTIMPDSLPQFQVDKLFTPIKLCEKDESVVRVPISFSSDTSLAYLSEYDHANQNLDPSEKSAYLKQYLSYELEKKSKMYLFEELNYLESALYTITSIWAGNDSEEFLTLLEYHIPGILEEVGHASNDPSTLKTVIHKIMQSDEKNHKIEMEKLRNFMES